MRGFGAGPRALRQQGCHPLVRAYGRVHAELGEPPLFDIAPRRISVRKIGHREARNKHVVVVNYHVAARKIRLWQGRVVDELCHVLSLAMRLK